MKRLISFIAAAVMMFTMSVSAAGLDFLKEEYKSYESAAELSFTLNKPIDFLDGLAEAYPASLFVNLKTLAESLFGAESNMNVKVSISDDYKQIRMSMEGTQSVPAEVNRNLTLNVDAKCGMWIDLDFSDGENPTYDIIAKYPYMDKYLKIDIAELAKSDGGEAFASVAAVYDKLLNKEAIGAISAKAADLLTECGTVTARGAAVTVKLDDAAAKKYILGVAELALNIAADNGGTEKLFLPEATGNVMSALAVRGMLAGVRDTLDKIQIFGKDGITITYTLAGKYVGGVTSDIHFSIDPAAAARVFGAELDTEGVLDFTLHMKQTYKNVNRYVKVDFPELTDENSVLFNEMMYGYDTMIVSDGASPFIGIYEEGEYLAAGRDGAYFGVRNLFESADSDTFDIAYDNGLLTVTAAEGRYGFKTVKFRVGENIVNVDGMDLALNYPAIERDNKVYVDDFFVKAVFDYDLSSMSYDLLSKVLEVGFWNSRAN